MKKKITQKKIQSLKDFFIEKDFSGCLERASELLIEHPNSEIVLNIIGLCHAAKGEFDQAIRAYEHAIEVNAQFAEAHYNLAHCLSKISDSKSAIKKYKDAILSKPNYPRAFLGLANALKQAGEVPLAIDAYNEAIRLDPKFSEAYFNLANSFKSLKLYRSAIENYKLANRFKPGFAECYNNMGIALHEEEKLTEAITSFKAALRINPAYVDAWFNIANSYKEKGDLDHAVESYRKTLHINPDSLDALLHLGRTLLQKTNLTEAVESFQKILNRDPGLPGVHYYLGLCYYGLRDYLTAIEHFKITSFEKSRSYLLRCYFLLNMELEFVSQFEKLQEDAQVNAMIGSLGCRAAIKFDLELNNLFCKNPLDFVVHRDISMECNFDHTFIEEVDNIFANKNTTFLKQNLLTEGTQTAGNIFASEVSSTRNIRRIIIKELARYRDSFDQSDAGLIRNWPSRFKLYGWLIRMRNGGSLSPHMHENGWLSGSVYINVPKDLDSDEGNLVVCIDDESASEHKRPVEKKVLNVSTGSLCLFPSSLLHYTIPFQKEEDRIVLAFDMIPE